MSGRGRPKKSDARCPDPKHADSRVASKGTRQSPLGLTRRYRCTPKVGDPHSFSLIEGPVPMPIHSPAPPCPEHEGSRVVRAGTYATSTVKVRQMYRCSPADGSPTHRFVPDLARDHVHAGADSCVVCEELRGTHRGDRAVARRHSWSARLVAEALKELAEGKSYAAVGREMRRKTNRTRTRKPQLGPDGKPVEPKHKYAGTGLSANAWHIAADWVEAFSPVLWADLEPRLLGVEAAIRGRNDERLADGVKLEEPMVLLLDDIPVEIRGRRDYFILVAAQVEWTGTGKGRDAGRQVRLRLVRGYPNNDHHAWKLLLDELGYRPDFVIADRGTGLVKAVEDVYGKPGTPGAVPLLPSLFHMREAVEKALLDTPGSRRDPGTRKAVYGVARLLRPELENHLLTLRRSTLTAMTPTEWAGWWDQLEVVLTRLGLPLEKAVRRRAEYEGDVAALLPVYQAYPQLPVSTGGIEVALRQRIKPVLQGRQHAFANLERVNRLFDLVVCRDHAVFDDTLAVAELIRRDNEGHGGWATPLRYVQDALPADGSRYSSLRDQQLMRSRAREAGLV